MRALKAVLRRLRRDTRGISLVELAVAMPVMLSLGLYGTEVAYMTVVNMEVSQIAISVADNASRLGQTDNTSVMPTVNETQIDSVMAGALVEGNSFDFNAHGRIILSSLEMNKDTRQQYIHWQRCSGDLGVGSAYGTAGTTLAGMGPAAHLIKAPDSSTAVMFVEVYYNYQPLFGNVFVKNTMFHREATFIVRDNRNLTPNGSPDGITAGSSAPKSHCS
ncbi:TadE/TadG family type IV pilus assembly protein [Novosphingobium beihaiensis]|uniref:Pilus assembly protein TadE n=1 Tax=Novosphingobium beihaiensis TaxID=2930389 RepID=A0ABT0BM51_9SPHN|nr:pilus assembly protein TadE [Novosphingobium beihaiensis]MCJ2185928.1 pilus assembly protein TadE [Novosphingobium beihaiensis]